MARKNLLASVTTSLSNEDASKKSNDEARFDYARRGASRSMMISIDEMAENARRMIDGETIVNLDPGMLDASFVGDRIDGQDEAYAELLRAIKEQGQSSPILVRPNPLIDGRFMIVFGHRRAKVARELGIPVRAVVKPLEDIAHIIAQGQENTARANLSFIEKALFAKKLSEMGQAKDTIKSALTIDDTLLSRMLSIAETIPDFVLNALGAARGVGRDRWEDLKKLLAAPINVQNAKDVIASEELKSIDLSNRFNFLVGALEAKRKPARKVSPPNIQKHIWSPSDKSLIAETKGAGTSFTITLRKAQAGEFGSYISKNLEQLYQAFKESEKLTKAGD
jgi:ParB family transcriptional regulator, chromosome partitioning protein